MGTPLSRQEIIDILARRYGDKIRAVKPPGVGAEYAVVDRQHLLPVMECLKNHPDLQFDFLMDVTAVDHLQLELEAIGERFAVIYQLCSTRKGHRFQVKTPVPEDDASVPSVIQLWQGALWAERETHDMFGIEFDGNPDMRRLLMPEDFPGFPLRKDYPLRGRGERDSFPQYRPNTESSEPSAVEPHRESGA